MRGCQIFCETFQNYHHDPVSIEPQPFAFYWLILDRLAYLLTAFNTVSNAKTNAKQLVLHF